MIDWLANHAGVTGLLFFFVVFGAIVFWAFHPSNKEKLEQHKFIPLNGDKQESKS